MTTPAELGDLRALGLADEPLGRVHRFHSGCAGFATAAGDAAKPLGGVDVLGKVARRGREAIVAGFEMTGDAVVPRRLGGGMRWPDDQRQQGRSCQPEPGHPHGYWVFRG